jgi:hypothetical protein
MTVKEIVHDLLKYKMITSEAALVLLRAEADAIAYRITKEKTSYNPKDLEAMGIWTCNTTLNNK